MAIVSSTAAIFIINIIVIVVLIRRFVTITKIIPSIITMAVWA